MCMSVSPACLYSCVPHVCLVPVEAQRGLELEISSHNMGSGNLTLVLWDGIQSSVKSSLHSSCGILNQSQNEYLHHRNWKILYKNLPSKSLLLNT